MSRIILSIDYAKIFGITLLLKNKGRALMDKKDLNIAIGNRIRLLREGQGKTRDRLSEEAEISPHFLFEIETGKKSMTSNTIINIAKALNVTTDFILTGATTSTVTVAPLSKTTPIRKIVTSLESLPSEQLILAEQFIEIFSLGLHTKRKVKRLR